MMTILLSSFLLGLSSFLFRHEVLGGKYFLFNACLACNHSPWFLALNINSSVQIILKVTHCGTLNPTDTIAACHSVGIISTAKHSQCSCNFQCKCPVMQNLPIIGMRQAIFVKKQFWWWSSHDDMKKVTIKHHLAEAVTQNSISFVLLLFISILNSSVKFVLPLLHCCFHRPFI